MKLNWKKKQRYDSILSRISRIFAASLFRLPIRPLRNPVFRFCLQKSVRIQLSIVNVSRMRAFRSSNPYLSFSLVLSLSFSLSLFCLERPLLESLFYFGTPSIRDWTERLWKSENNKIDADGTDRGLYDNRWQWEQWKVDVCVLCARNTKIRMEKRSGSFSVRSRVAHMVIR